MTIHVGHFHVLSPVFTRCVSIAVQLPAKGSVDNVVAAFEYYNSTHEPRSFSRKQATKGVLNRLARDKDVIRFESDGMPHTIDEFMHRAMHEMAKRATLQCDPAWFSRAWKMKRLVPGLRQNPYVENIRYAIWRANQTKMPLGTMHDLLMDELRRTPPGKPKKEPAKRVSPKRVSRATPKKKRVVG